MQLRWAASIACLLVLSPPAAAPTRGADSNPGVVPVKSRPNGKSYSEWAQSWWTWASPISADRSPMLDTTGRSGGVRSLGTCGFLARTIFGGTVEPAVTVPTGTSLFFPAHSAMFWAPDDMDDATFSPGTLASWWTPNAKSLPPQLRHSTRRTSRFDDEAARVDVVQ